MKNFDVIIIGGGAAGISAAIWCNELGLKTLLLEEKAELGGQLLWTFNPIKNYLGVETENGKELRDIFLKQIENYTFEYRLNTIIKSVNLSEKKINLDDGKELLAKFLVIATGIKRRKLGIEGENLKGVLLSGKRDSDLVKGKNVCVVGGGDAALENALILAEKAEKVYLIHRNDKFRGREEFISQIKQNPKINIVFNSKIGKIIGKEKVESVELNNGQTLIVQAVVIRIGVESNTKFFQGQIETDNSGYIKIDSNCETSINGVFAIGDVANPIAPTISSAVGMGSTAAKVIYSKI
ncbi:MAG: NAD(P)/FAD-dependent oxidoreductase [Pyrinomonadaceae bacterium]|jgi:thioredoxin reductase (NADPH)|nr:NAD(P)/FAD-dependent oxidoreductase [Pyrinomonadaceae bacterium]